MAEKSSEFYNLLYGTTRVRKMTPLREIPNDLLEYNAKQAEGNTLRLFRAEKVRRSELRQILEESAEQVQNDKNLEKYETEHECLLKVSNDTVFNNMKNFAELASYQNLLPDWEKNIRNLIPDKLRKKFHDIIEKQMDEVKIHYQREVHRIGINYIMNIEEIELRDLPYKFQGRTENRGRFLKNRCLILKKYFHGHKLIRNIISKGMSKLPECLCDFQRYRTLTLSIDKFVMEMETDLKRGLVLINSYYTEIVRILLQPFYVHDVPQETLRKFLKCCSMLLGLQIKAKLMSTIERFLEILSDPLTAPYLKLDLKCANHALYTFPLMREIYSTFHSIVRRISKLGQQLPSLESVMAIKTEDKFIPTILPEWYLEKCHQTLAMILKDLFEPVNNYVENVHEKFQIVYNPFTREEIVKYVALEREFQNCLDKVEEFNNFVREINGMTEWEYFLMCQLRLEDAKTGLKKYTEEVRKFIIGELIKRHRNFNYAICYEFETIVKRATSIPSTTKELFELGDYMIFARTTLMEQLRQKIALSLSMIASLFEMTTLDKDHIELNNTTISWLTEVRKAFDFNSIRFEQTKFELEEHLQSERMLLNNAIEEMFPRLVILDDMDDFERIHEYIDDMRKFVRYFDKIDAKVEWINNEEALFKFPQTVYTQIKELKDMILPFYELIYRGYQWKRHLGVWLDGPFENLDAPFIENKCNEYYADFSKTSKSYKTKIKMQMAMNYPYGFEGFVDDPDPYQQPAPMKLCHQLMESVKWFKQYVPLALVFCNPALRQRHWDDMSVIAGFDLTPDAGTTLRKIINMDLLENLDKYETISVSATKELALQHLLDKMIHDWDNVVFQTMPHKDSGVQILSQLDDIYTLLEEHIVKVQAMRGSAFVRPIREEVETFYELLLRMHRTLEEWAKVQVQWMYLLPIFSSKDIVAQLPDEAILFNQVDGVFRRAMIGVARDPYVRETAGSIGLYEAMKEANEMMEEVNRGVADYLEKKRLFFPRFFFLSNDDMLEILSETKDPLRVQPHLKKCFQGINKLGFNEELEIFSMFGDDLEEVKIQELISTAAARGCVEKWLLEVETQMVESVRHEVVMSYLDYEINERVVWVRIWPGMVVLCVSQIYWSIEVQNCLMTHIMSAMETLYDKLRMQIYDLVQLVKGQLSKQNRTTLTALITIDVHAQDIVKLLIDKNILDETDFDWLAQLRYYWEDDVLVRIINATVPYAYEYLGNDSRLVITPLTDRCYRTLVGAYSLHLNGAPEGPAGTGKTETVKDLAKAVAVQCVVFNCSEGLDYKNMGKFFKGLAACGAWACYDEFNRIELEVLSVVAQQILSIILAVRADAPSLVIEGTEVPLNPAVYICITMNPGYAGRSELPDNLKVLFRTVAMMVPDYAMIGEIFLYSAGFSSARILSVKIVTTYKLCSEQLSTQSHYDYGMRAVKSVLTAAQNIKLKYPDGDETTLLLRSIIDVNLPKFLAHDVPLFEGIIADLFPGVVLPPPTYDSLLKAIGEVCVTRNLQPVDGLLLKIIQTYEMMIVRHGFMLVGDPFGGKTTVLHVLADALTLLQSWGNEIGAVTRYTTINPKAITLGQLYGQFDEVSSEWSDGICALTFRQFSSEDTMDRKWIIFDGPVDAVWIENLNTVLDDNKKLCLTSGEIMQMSSVMSMIFEAMDLTFASPATVSRCGMIYIESQVLGWKPFVKSWIHRINPIWRNEEILEDLFNWLVEPSLLFVRKQCEMSIFAGWINLIVSTLNIIEMLMEDAVRESTENALFSEDYVLPWIQASFLVAFVWGVAGTLSLPSREKFNEFWIQLWQNEIPDHPMPGSIASSVISLPTEDLVHDCYYVFRGKGAWKPFSELARAEKIADTQSIGQMLIPTIDTVKYQDLFLRHIKHRSRFLLFGETGTGKSFYIQDMMMNKLSEKDYLVNMITFTTKTTSSQTQELVVSKLFKRRRRHFGPMGESYCVVFIDDVNVPTKEVYGAQPPIELLRQYFDHKEWCGLKEPEKIQIFDTMIICAMGGRRQEVYHRFLRHFNLYTICPFSTESIFKIFTNVAFAGLRRNGFSSDVMPVVTILVNATSAVFNSAVRQLRPTPIKSHYLFNLRDFSRVITGCAMMKKESAESKQSFIKLWVHEILRVFGDRLIEQPDHRCLFQELRSTVNAVFRESFDTIFENLPKFDGELTEMSLKDLIFGTFMDDSLPEDRKYEEIPSLEEYRQVALTALEEYNNTHASQMDIVLFRYALEHLARISRILATPAGSLLMIGIGGSGRQSLTRLAAEMAGYPLFQPEISSTYFMHEWREDLKKVLRNSGGIGKDLVFLFTEGQIKEESFLEDIDSLLNSGEVPNMYSVEERQEIVEMTRLDAQGGNRNLDISILSVLAFFINRCREKLHMMLCFSPIGESFRTRLRVYTSLVNCCTIDWFEIWPEEALEQVAIRSTTNIDVSDDVKINAVVSSKYFHVCAKDISHRFYQAYGRKTYVTSAAFLDLIKSYAELMKEKQIELIAARDRYIGGLDKVRFAAEQVSKMKETLEALKPQLEASYKLTAETMKAIERENVSVERATVMVKKEEDVANVQAQIATELKAECEADLAEALPVLEDALAALDTLKPADITFVKAMKNPPQGVKLVMAAICVMLDIPPDRVPDPTSGKMLLDYWGPSKRVLGDMKFLDHLRNYDKDNIPVHRMQVIKHTYMTDKNFEPKVVAKASQAAEGLCKWVRAMVLYDKVAKEVAPKKAKLLSAQLNYEETMNLLNEKRQMLEALNAKLKMLNDNLQETLARKIDLENQVTLCRNKLIRAEKLINGLGGEKDRWMQVAKNLQKSYDTLPGDILLSCGMIAYLGPFTTQYRQENLEKWRRYIKNLKIPCSESYAFVETLGSEIKINSWNIHGLPRDSFSTENAIIMDISKRWSLFVDPQSQANKWIRNMEKFSGLEILKLTDSSYMKIMEQCIEYGKPVLVENIGEELDPALDPILTKNYYKVGGLWYITLGEKVIQYDLRFRLYITTKLRNPHYMPEIFNKITLINFALTIEGLEDQLLGIVVAKERPDLQQKRENLIVQSAANKKALQQTEDNILRTLTVAGDTILEDEEAIEILDSSKILSIDIIRKQEAAKETEATIETFRMSYKPIAKHSSALYYTITDLPNIDPMYQYSLAWFINLYILSIETANKSKFLERRLMFLKDTFTYNLYQNVCRSLFEKDKVLYSFILHTTILLYNNDISKDEMSFFLSGGITMGTVEKKPANWIPDKMWEEISKAGNAIPSFVDFRKSFTQNLTPWHKFYDLIDPQDAQLPSPWEEKLTDFEKLIVMRMIRPDKIISKISQFVENGLGPKFVKPPSFDIAKSYGDSNCLLPLIFILSPGSDPMSALTNFAESTESSSRLFTMSLGQGQGPVAKQLIQQGQNDGSWVCLQNCHLAVSWMPELEKICENLDLTNTSINFRLWLTSYPTPKFPIAVLQNGIKMTNEPPTGLQLNMMRSYTTEPLNNSEFFEGCYAKKKEFTRLLYALCFFHAVVQQRRNYGPQGWNISYGFNESDFQISVEQLQIFINEHDHVPFKAIKYLTGECNYGGRVTDDRDRRCLNTILDDFYNIEVIKNPQYCFVPEKVGPEYMLPKRYDYRDYLKQIETIPLVSPPEVFGLNTNAGITRDLQLSRDFFDSMISIQGRVTVGDTSEENKMILAIKRDIYERLPNLFDIESAKEKYPVSYMESMNTVLTQELERYNILLHEIRRSLDLLEKALEGLIVLTPGLEILSNYLLSSKIPPGWIQKSAYPCLKPLPSFINDFIARLNFFQNWLDRGKPRSFWISGFSFVHAFLTGTLQNFARKYKMSIDLIDFDFQVMSVYETNESPEDGVYVYGMYLAGARWDTQLKMLNESYPKVLWDVMPIVWLKPCEMRAIDAGNRYECPLYITSERFGTLKTTGHSTNYVLSILLDSGKPQSHWIKRGLALLCQLDD